MKRRMIQRSQTLNPFGVGAILDVEGESFVAADITRWKSSGEPIREPRLERALGVEGFRMAPAAPDNPFVPIDSVPGVPYFRFPQWLFCPICRRMSRWTTAQEQGGTPVCSACSKRPRLTPMRFVIACPRGHLADVPWDLWAHSLEKTGKCVRPDLEFQTRTGGSGLEYIFVVCRTCRAERSLAGIASPDSLGPLNIPCPGRQPWQQPEEARRCDAIPQVLQRGATNLTFASIESSIDIPPFSDYSVYGADTLRVTGTDAFRMIASSPDHPIVPILVDRIAEDLGIPRTTVQLIVDGELRSKGQPLVANSSDGDELNDLLIAEYRAFLSPDRSADDRDRFVKYTVPFADYVRELSGEPYATAARMLATKLGSLVQVTRLREVRALKGFSRLAPTESQAEDGEEQGRFSRYSVGGNRRSGKISPVLVPADLGGGGRRSKWLPAVEIFGEGIFLSLNESALAAWERIPGIRKDRVEVLEQRRIRAASYLPPATPRLVLLHTLAHLLIRQLSFECGYALASLRERIYSGESMTGEPMAGILIYTAAGDAEGTLGGLVREGEVDRIFPTIIKALQTAEWCSSDPLCRESKGQGYGAMNLAACHACTLLPETSCTLSNRLLDRSMLLGASDAPSTGFFSELITFVTATMNAEGQGL